MSTTDDISAMASSQWYPQKTVSHPRSPLLGVGIIFSLLLPIGYDASSFAQTTISLHLTPKTLTATVKEIPALRDIKTLLQQQQAEQAIPKLKKLIQESSRSKQLDEAYFLLGSALVQTKSYAEAITTLDRFLRKFPKSGLQHRARLLLAAAHGQEGHLDKALPLLAEVRSLAPDSQSRRDALTLTGELLTQKGDPLRAIQAWLEEMRLAPPDQQTVSRDRIRDLIMHKLDSKTLLRVRNGYRVEFPGDLALIRLAELHQERKEQHVVVQHLNMFLKRFPTHEYAPTAKALLQSFTRNLQEAQYVLVALLPLSGKLSRFGTEALRGIQISIEKGKEVFSLPSLELAIKDSEADKVFIRSELSQLINDFRPLAVVGPLESRQVQTLAELAERTHTPFLTPTATIPNVRRFGNFMFSTALTYQLQSKQLVQFAMDRAKFKHMAILHPNTDYGKALSRLFTQEVQRRGGEIIAVETYEEKDTDFGTQIKRLKAEDLARYGTLTEEKGKEGEPRPIYTPGFDAMFIPGRAREVALITAQLVFFDIHVPLLGTNGWNAPALLRLADRSIDGSVFVEGFFVGSANPDTQDFIDRYKQRFHHDPSPFAAQAYEATHVVLKAVHQGATSAEDVQQFLMTSHALPTLEGTASFNAQGILDRPLQLLQIRNGKIAPAQDPVLTPEVIP